MKLVLQEQLRPQTKGNTVATGRVEVSYCVQLAETKDKTRQKK